MSFAQRVGSEATETPKCIRVLVATPYGDDGPGGIDRLNDLIFKTVHAQTKSNVTVDRLVTRGKKGLFAAQFVFAYALTHFVVKALVGNFDLLHIHLSIRGSSYRKTVLGLAARLLKVPYIVHLHGCGFDEYWSETNDYLAHQIKLLFKHSAHCIVLGSYWARAIAARVPEIADRISVLPNATSPIRLEQEVVPGGRIKITFLGQLGRRKGTPQLIEALAKLAGRNDWSATIAGDGDVDESRTQVQRQGIADRVEIPGWLGSSDTELLLRRSDILVLPSFSENLPMVILEAFAHGVAVISTPVGAVPEVIDHERNGLLVPVGDVAALHTAIERLVSDRDLRKRLGSAAKADHAQRYEIGPYVTRLVAVWHQTLDELKSHRQNSD
jgi:glycosyltransferase involved in cell wall biosynthesis